MMRSFLFLSGILLLFYGCTPAEKKQKDPLNYFDLKGYFRSEAIRLAKGNPLFIKTVMVNNSSEAKKLRITDWAKEFSVFADADINRAAWKGLFRSRKTKDQEIYTSDNEKVPVKEVLITKKDDKIYCIQILVKNANVLYTSTDTLSYYPDSLYQVKKKQNIRLLSEKNYSIIGKFK